eukprot:COSAG02_NODE_245_length_27293_cov_16.488012_12_plen_62_part_00
MSKCIAVCTNSLLVVSACDCCAQETAVKWFLSHTDTEVKRACNGCAESYEADPIFEELVKK